MKYSGYMPPYKINDRIIDLVAQISELVGTISVTGSMNANPQLRRENRIKTIQASLAIENNTLTIDQVTDIINGKRVLGAPGEIKEVKNAYEAYEHLLDLNPYSIDDLLSAHKILMTELTKEAGRLRSAGVGIFAGETLIHMAPPADLVPQQIFDLLHWVETATAHPLIKSSVFHYEFEFIHPFMDGNGRMGRMWQTLLLYQWKKLFAWLPIETLIKERQEEYYNVLSTADKASEATPFIEFILVTILDAIKEIASTDQVNDQATDQVKKLLAALGDDTLSAAVLMNKIGLKHKATFRENYLNPALEMELIEMTVPDKPRSNRQKYRRKY